MTPKLNNMNYKQCPHYDELLKVLSEGRDFEDINFEITEVENCEECSKDKKRVCTLWLSLTFIENMKPQIGMNDAKITIDTLDEQMKKISLQLVKNLIVKNDNK